MSEKYKFGDSCLPHSVSYSVVNWINLFVRMEYFNVIKASLSYCIDNKGLIVNAWCIMPSHIHLIIRSDTSDLSEIMRDMKKFTSKKLIQKLKITTKESRRNWLLRMFKKSGKSTGQNKYYQVWQQGNHPIELDTNEKVNQRLQYLHMNPVKAGFVEKQEDWKFSSAKQYAGGKGMLMLEKVEGYHNV